MQWNNRFHRPVAWSDAKFESRCFGDLIVLRAEHIRCWKKNRTFLRVRCPQTMFIRELERQKTKESSTRTLGSLPALNYAASAKCTKDLDILIYIYAQLYTTYQNRTLFSPEKPHVWLTAKLYGFQRSPRNQIRNRAWNFFLSSKMANRHAVELWKRCGRKKPVALTVLHPVQWGAHRRKQQQHTHARGSTRTQTHMCRDKILTHVRLSVRIKIAWV